MSNKNIFGVILAGGQGKRMGNVEKPKQFIEINGKPIIIYTIEKFIYYPDFEKIIILSPKPWIQYTMDVIKKYIPIHDKIVVIEGGETRNQTIINSIKYIEEVHNLDKETIIVTHDAVRPFVTHRIIEENIKYAKEYGSCDTVISAVDTIVESVDNKFISSIPNRVTMYQGQTPQTFHAWDLKSIYSTLSDIEKEALTDACKIMVIKGKKVHLVEGELFNIKITFPYDIKIASVLLNGGELC